MKIKTGSVYKSKHTTWTNNKGEYWAFTITSSFTRKRIIKDENGIYRKIVEERFFTGLKHGIANDSLPYALYLFDSKGKEVSDDEDFGFFLFGKSKRKADIILDS